MNRNWINNQILIIALLLILANVSGCTSSNSDSLLPNDKYVAVEETKYNYGIVISGQYPYPGMAQPAPRFYYHGPAYPTDYPTVNDSLKILLGVYQHNEYPPVGLTTSISVKGIYDYPYQSESGPIITNVGNNGTVFMTYNNMTIDLRINETWTSPRINTSTETKNASGSIYVVQYQTWYKFENLGMFEKSDLL
ncbi:MAG: hypothetical protein WB014_07375 [Methanosarcina sp.]